ncbi:MAG TPA: hypothetical protein VF163_06995, partial [Micromonosporaceae bacterium]
PFNGGAPSEEAVLLSPDGRSVAGDTSMQAAPVEDLATRFGTAVLDLVTGQVRAFDAGVPVAWAPDGRTLLTRSTEPDRLRTLDPTTGAVRELLTLPYRAPSASFVAFSPDGRQVALQLGQTVHIVDLSTGTSRPLADIGPDRRLAGAGAWLPEGQLALWRMAGCAHDCDPTELNDRRLTITYVDSRTGVEVPGPHLDALTGLGARLLGWQVDGDAVVEVFAAGEVAPQATIGRSWLSDDTDLAGQAPRVLALHPGGSQEELLALPDDARQVQVAGELLRADRFGGPSPNLATRVADWLGPKRWTVSAVALLVLAVVTLMVVRRRRKAASQGRSPARTRFADAD